MNAKFTSTLVGLLLIACAPGNQNNNEDISGVYVREQSIEVISPETNKQLGMRTIRDTIYVRSLNDEIEVSNRKWMMNDYDNEGWRSMAHSDDRPKPTYIAIFDDANSSLNSKDGISLFVNRKKGTVHWSEGMDYRMVKP